MDKKIKAALSGKEIYVITGIFLVVGMIVIVILAFLKQDALIIGGSGQVACTMEAKICSDGSSVGRSGPKCEFAACPAFPTGVSVILKASNGLSEKREFTSVVAYSTEDMKKINEQITSASEDLFAYPGIDFTKEFVFAATLGARNTGGFNISVKSVTETDNKIEIVFQETTPGSGCMLTQAIETPYVIARKDTPAAVAMQKSVEVSLIKVAGKSCDQITLQ
jgi:hypothetical protein